MNEQLVQCRQSRTAKARAASRNDERGAKALFLETAI